jgi:hypothetical protein
VSANRVCWTRAAVDFATQVDVGGLELDDPRADAVFQAIHQALPVRRKVGSQTTGATEDDVLKEFTRPIDSNEPLLLFVTGEKGTGKSHLVRWLKSRIGPRPTWHVVYIEKRNTSLRRVTERILDGIDTPKAKVLRQTLAQASSEISSDQEAMSALLARLDQLVTFDPATDIKGLGDISASELAELRHKTHRLLGDFTFREELSRDGGPIHRIVRLARGGPLPAENVDEADLHLAEADLRVDEGAFDGLGAELSHLVESLMSNRPLRTEVAALCDWYLSRAKKEVFMGQGTDLLDVFQEVREEIADRRQELCLIIEDLVLLHGIDKELAQALTIPASARLCKLRAAIAVTSGYLSSLDTFTDRGVHFTLDIRIDAIGRSGLRDFVGRYLNAGRLSDEALATISSTVPNACLSCPDREACHRTFGTSSEGYGLYPLNGPAVARLVELASPGDFQPRQILREVIRAPLETAEEELPASGIFPSIHFARTLDESRRDVPYTMRQAIRRDNLFSPDAEVSLRAFYAAAPPAADQKLESIAQYLGTRLTTGLADNHGDQDDQDDQDDDKDYGEKRKRARSEVEQWADGADLLSSSTAMRIRRWICEATIAQLRNNPYGLVIRKHKNNEWQIGSHTLRASDVVIRRAHGGGALEPDYPFEITATDENAVIVGGILAAADGNGLDAVDQGKWFFYLQTRISDYAATLAQLATAGAATTLPVAVQALEVLRYATAEPGQTATEALAAMLAPLPPRPNPVLQEFVREVRPLREQALTTIRCYATGAKGAGKPALLDAGPLYRGIRSRLKARSVEAPPEGGGPHLLQGLRIAQSRAAERAWAEVARAVGEVARFLDPAEDLPATLKVVDRLVKEGHGEQKLPRMDSETVYNEARNQVDPEMMEAYRRMSKKVAGAIGPDDLWDLFDNPIPRLTALRHYAAVTDDLLSSLETSLVGGPDGAAADIDALTEEFRGLASRLDDVVNREGR